MKTAMRLIEYEKELQTKDVYSLVALSCYFNECYKECSKAFVKLERLQDITEKETEYIVNPKCLCGGDMVCPSVAQKHSLTERLATPSSLGFIFAVL